jgi:anti-sigma factor RsiW
LSCEPERVTGFVDGELDPRAAAGVAAHLETCPACRAQAESERDLRARLARLAALDLPAGLEARVKQAFRAERRAFPALARWALPLAAALFAALWLRGYAPFVAWDLARDHAKCFSKQPLPAKVWSGEPAQVAGWFRESGSELPALPAQAGELALVGARYCPLASLAYAPHVYYASAGRHASVFVVPQGVRFEDPRASQARGEHVRLLRVEGRVVGIVAEEEDDARALETALRPVLAAWASR